MARDAGAWEPKPGERVRIVVGDIAGVHPGTPTLGSGFFVRHLGDHERFPYEVDVNAGEGYKGYYCYARDEIFPVEP